jgi:ribosomal protein S18 acetylase RimI-like enzyme
MPGGSGRPVTAGPSDPGSLLGLRAHEAFVVALGGSVLEIAGARLVLHERVPAPTFNYIVLGAIGPGRQAAFFERALDHFFQRAVRPAVVAPTPLARHLEEGLHRFGFRAEADPLRVLQAVGSPPAAPPPASLSVAELAAGEIRRILPFWAESQESEELGRSFEVLVHHPNPGESTRAWIVSEEGRDLASAIAYGNGPLWGLHGIGTVSGARGRGAASAVVRAALAAVRPSTAAPLTTLARGDRALASLERLGFSATATLAEYRLPKEAELHLPALGPPAPPRWRPPRGRPPP